MCPPGPVFGLRERTLAQAVPACVGAAGLGFGAAAAGAAEAAEAAISGVRATARGFTSRSSCH
jgi:hypothetical protein